MSRKTNPAYQIYPADILRSADLRKCTWATRGLWWDILALMWFEQEQGKMQGTPEELCRLLGCKTRELNKLLTEAKQHKFADVTFCNGIVTIVNRRMHSEFIRRQATKKRVFKHREKEKRICNEDVTLHSSTSTSTSCNNTVTYIEFSDFWNSHKSLPKIRTMTKDRKGKLQSRMNEPDFAGNWKKIIELIVSTPFLVGDNERGWKADVDWILKNSTNYVRVLEGKYNQQQTILNRSNRDGNQDRQDSAGDEPYIR